MSNPNKSTPSSHLAKPPLRTTPLARPSRKQVHRACEWCRSRRVKCDSSRPCRNCRARGGTCSDDGPNESLTLMQAYAEIEKLRLKVKNLETQIDHKPEASPPLTTSSHSSTPSTDKTPDCEGNYHWEGIYVYYPRSIHKLYYGPLSTIYFISRIVKYLALALNRPFLEQALVPTGGKSPSRLQNAPRGESEGPECPEDANRPLVAGAAMRSHLTRMQEEFFLDVFWGFHHPIYPIIDEREFARHYDSLWEDGRKIRKASPLADILVALAMQYGLSFLPRPGGEPTAEHPFEDATIAGRWYYSRCQRALASELDTPSLTTLQCHIYSYMYLSWASFHNMAHGIISVALRTAQMLGLHLEPPETMSLREREQRKLIWWVLYTVETKSCLKYGRPFAASASEITTSFASDAPEVAALLGTSGTYGPDITFLTYAVQCQKMVSATRVVYQSMQDSISSLLRRKRVKSLYADPEILEAGASFLDGEMYRLEAWVAQVPDGLKTARRSGGAPFSTDVATLDLNTDAPAWLRRQRLALEVVYHGLAIELLRPFMTFSPHAPNEHTPTAERLVSSCLGHCIALTTIIHQVHEETDLFNGWQDMFQIGWLSYITTVGFVLAYPLSPSAPQARKSLNRAQESLNVFARTFAVARSANGILNDLVAKADRLVGQLGAELVMCLSLESVADEKTEAYGEKNTEMSGTVTEGAAGTDVFVGAEMEGLETSEFADFIDWAQGVDSFNNFEDFYSETWAYHETGQGISEWPCTAPSGFCDGSMAGGLFSQHSSRTE